MSRKKIITLIIIILFLAIAGGGYYYWWIGTPEYSMKQFREAVKSDDMDSALKYVAVNSIFESWWSQVGQKLLEEGAMDSLIRMGGGIRNLEPAARDYFKERIISSIENYPEMPSDLQKAWREEAEIQREGDKTSYDTKEGLKMILRQTNGRYWEIRNIKGLLEDFEVDEIVEDLDFSYTPMDKEKDSKVISALNKAGKVMEEVYAKYGNYDNFTFSSPDKMSDLSMKIANNNPDDGVYNIERRPSSSSTAAAIYSELNRSATYYCVDSKGESGYSVMDPREDGNTGTCPPDLFSKWPER